MKFWSRKNKIEFFNSDSNIIENFPIIESKDLKLKWVKRTREDFEDLVKKGTNDIPGFAHLSRCPGIFDLFKYGYIIPLHKDIIIKPQDGGFECRLPRKSDPLIISDHMKSSIDLITKPPWTADFILKIGTGWHVIAPKGVKFLVLPIAYPDNFDFTSTIGIFNPTLATTINFQMFWNTTESETLIRAGTPLGHLIPLTEKKYQMVQRTANQQDRDWIEKLDNAYSSTFWTYTMRGKVTAMYNKYWKR